MENKTRETIAALITASIEAKKKLLEPEHLKAIESVSETIINAYKNCKKVIVFGNGGSASDALHFAGEFVSRFEKNRMALPAIALSENVSTITSIGNDYSYEEIFSRQVEAFTQPGDVVIGISTSGNSPNVIRALESAKKLKAVTIGFTGSRESKIKSACDICFCAPSPVTARIQECHILAIHIICGMVEGTLFGEK
jgi:D-sedoheptulose 7-phosphate isomerase